MCKTNFTGQSTSIQQLILLLKEQMLDKKICDLHLGKNIPMAKKYDVSIVKNYLSLDEISSFERNVIMYLDYAEYQATRNMPMTMEDWETRLNRFLEFNEHEILNHYGKVTAEIAKSFAETEFEKYRIKQDRLFESDFDRFLSLENEIK